MSETKRPVLGNDVYIAPTSYVGGDVVLGDQVTVMHHVVVRGDIAPIRIGSRVNLQDSVVVHTAHETPLDIADDVGVGHGAIVHCRRIAERTLIGIGAVLLDHCEIGSRCIIAAGAVVAPGSQIPDGSVVMGLPSRVVRQVTEGDLETIDQVIRNYLQVGRLHAAGRFPNIAG
jgi:carbonic anhydrase/acetyltransferase-like protein (isoleucine patch superfamily)